MSENRHTVGIFTMPQDFPCGVGSSCCGPVGQSEEEIAALKAAIEGLGAEVEVHDVTKTEVLQKYLNVSRLLRSFGWGIVPILTVEEEVICMGSGRVEEAVKYVAKKLSGARLV